MKRIELWQQCDTESLPKKAKDISVFKNIQAVYLKAKYKMNADSIAKATGFSKSCLRQIHYNYRSNDDEAFVFLQKRR